MALAIFKALINGKEIIKTMCHEEHVIARIKHIQAQLRIRDKPIETELTLAEDNLRALEAYQRSVADQPDFDHFKRINNVDDFNKQEVCRKIIDAIETTLEDFDFGSSPINRTNDNLDADLMQDDLSTSDETRYDEKWRLHNKLMEAKGIKEGLDKLKKAQANAECELETLKDFTIEEKLAISNQTKPEEIDKLRDAGVYSLYNQVNLVTLVKHMRKHREIIQKCADNKELQNVVYGGHHEMIRYVHSLTLRYVRGLRCYHLKNDNVEV